MNLIVAVDSNWAIGSKNELLIRIPNDHKHFREETTGKVVVLGRKTLETFPQGMPLKNRTNIILSKDPNYQVKDAIVVHSIEELLEELKKYDEESIYIIGGESIYRQMLPYCGRNGIVYPGSGICGSQSDSVGRTVKFSQLYTVSGGSVVSVPFAVLCISGSAHQAAQENTGQVGDSRKMGVAGGYRHCPVGGTVSDRHFCRNCLDLA